jgi:outer membrane receptor protein involved in Fe transport
VTGWAQETEQQQPTILEEITVTATRREQSILEIPYNITAVSGELLDRANITDMSGLTRMIPGVTFIEAGPRGNGVNSGIIMRGINANPAGTGAFFPNTSSQTVSTYMDETPIFFNFRLADIDRVEILRGPQGTLYGSGSVGGTLRIIHNKPDPEAFSVRVLSRVGQTSDSDEINYSFDGVLNVPLGETSALRIVAGYQNIGGFIDATHIPVADSSGAPILADPSDVLGSGMVFHTVEDSDSADISHIRASLLWQITDNVDAVFTYHRQEDNADGHSAQTFSEVPGAQEREMTRYTLEPLDREVDLFSVDVTAQLGFATLTSATSYYTNDSDSILDFGGGLEDIDAAGYYYGGFPRITSPIYTTIENESFVQELRLVSDGDGAWDWVAGLFYSNQDRAITQLEPFPGFGAFATEPGHPLASYYLGAGASFADWSAPYLGIPVSAYTDEINYTLDQSYTAEDLAFFGELSYHINDAWQVTGGARIFWQDFSQTLFQTLPMCGPFCSDDFTDIRGVTQIDTSRSFNDQIFKLNTSYDLNDTTMLYFTWAEGFRRGGANVIPTSGPLGEDPALIPFEPDKATNYEVGLKGRLGERAHYTIAAYRIDWDDLQIQSFTVPGGWELVLNGDKAASKGVELELGAQVTDNFNVLFGYSYTDAKLTSDFVKESTIGRDGDRLIGVPKHQLSWSMDYFQPLAASEIQYHLDGSYRSEVNTALNDLNTNFTILEGFDIWNLSVNWNLDRWQFGAFVINLTDERGSTGIAEFFNAQHTSLEFVTRPRTISLLVGYSFD